MNNLSILHRGRGAWSRTWDAVSEAVSRTAGTFLALIVLPSSDGRVSLLATRVPRRVDRTVLGGICDFR